MRHGSLFESFFFQAEGGIRDMTVTGAQTCALPISSDGRFISEDPLGFAAGDMNLGRYVGNSPTTRTDPTGEIWPAVVIVVVVVVIFTAEDTHEIGRASCRERV